MAAAKTGCLTQPPPLHANSGHDRQPSASGSGSSAKTSRNASVDSAMLLQPVDARFAHQQVFLQNDHFGTGQPAQERTARAGRRFRGS